MARMEPVPGGRMASNWLTPNIPRFEMVNVPVLYSAGDSRFSLAFPTSSFHSLPSEYTSNVFAFRSVGVISPPSIATAMAMLISSLYLMAPAGSNAALTTGWFSRTVATALASIALTVTPLGFSCLYSSSKASVQMVRDTRKTGTSSVATMFLTTAFCMPSRGTDPAAGAAFGSAAFAAGAALLFSGAAGFAAATGFSPAAISTSSGRIRPNGPLPWIDSRGMFFFFARAFAVGVAMTSPLGDLFGV
mmetsp:Transcript_17103/g.65234  ORF Transcript_17103/g.65234 Transcript_17103/m.65234 type:complete len:247 (-) Transcript_17103:202-942(-)